jgi:hypothetical protein
MLDVEQALRTGILSFGQNDGTDGQDDEAGDFQFQLSSLIAPSFAKTLYF